jgi:hypothetical protein
VDAPSLAFLVFDSDRLVVEADDPGVGKSDTKDVAGEVVEHGLLAVSPGGDIKDPRHAPDCLGNDEVGTLSV